MPTSSPQPLDYDQQRLITIIKSTHTNLAVARKTRVAEIERRTAAAKRAIQAEYEGRIEAATEAIKLDVDGEIAHHESSLDEALIAAYNAGIPIRRMALDGFGNRFDGAVHQMLRDLRTDGRLGNRVGYQRNTSDALDGETAVEFPKPVDIETMLSDVVTVQAPVFTREPRKLVLVEADANGENEVSVDIVLLEMDPRDPYFKSIHPNARPGTPFLRATTATLYKHPATGALMVHESKEEGDVLWDHPVARWVKDHPEEAHVGFDTAFLYA
jgi:hypothetical protein